MFNECLEIGVTSGDETLRLTLNILLETSA